VWGKLKKEKTRRKEGEPQNRKWHDYLALWDRDLRKNTPIISIYANNCANKWGKSQRQAGGKKCPL
jgi:hypothetical protein